MIVKPLQGSLVDFARSISAKMVQCFPMLEGGGDRTFNLCAPALDIGTLETGVTWTATGEGPAVLIAEDFGIGLVRYAPADLTGAAMSAYIRFIPTFPSATIGETRFLWDADKSNADQFRLLMSANSTMRFRLHTSSAVNLDLTVNAWSAGDLVSFLFTYDGATMRIYQDSAAIGSGAHTGNITSNAGDDRTLGVQSGLNGLNSPMLCAYLWDRCLTPDEAVALDVDPYSMLRRSDPVELWTPSGGATTVPLTGTITGTASPSGDLTVTKSLSGTVTGAATPSGDLTIQGATVPLSGTVTGTASPSGDLTVSKPLSGTITGQALPTGNLTIQTKTIQLTGTITGTASPTGDLTVDRALAGTITGTASMTGVLTGVSSAPLPVDEKYVIRFKIKDPL